MQHNTLERGESGGKLERVGGNNVYVDEEEEDDNSRGEEEQLDRKKY